MFVCDAHDKHHLYQDDMDEDSIKADYCSDHNEKDD